MQQDERNKRDPGGDPALDGAAGGMGDGGDPAGSADTPADSALRKELKGDLGQALASATGQPGLAEADEAAKSEAGAETPAKE
jgi:hypothetical protein